MPIELFEAQDHTAGLELLEGTKVVETIRLTKSIVKVGRSPDADVQLLDTEASAIHCRFELVERAYQVFDCHSSNGTLVNGVRVLKARLKPGDVIRIGKVEFRYFERKENRSMELKNAFPKEELDQLAEMEQKRIKALLQKKHDELIESQRLHFTAWWSDGTQSEIRLDKKEEALGRASEFGHFAMDAELSRKHAKVSLEGDGFCYIEDLGSLNGTFLNGEKLESRQKVEAYDMIRIGQTRFKVKHWIKAAE